MGSLQDPEADAPARPEGALRWYCRTLWDMARHRCPRCRTGRIFRGVLEMNDPCPTCGLLFLREEGYFLGALYISYPVSVAILSAFFFAGSALLPNWDSYLVGLLALGLYFPLTPIVLRLSRVVWIYLDRANDPRGALAGAYEKRRLKQLADRSAVGPTERPGERPV